MNIIILAAGQSSRLYPLTLEIPKCMLDLGGMNILDYNIKMFDALGIKKRILVDGHNSEKIRSQYSDDFTFIHYPDFNKTNNLYTLNFAKNHLEGPIFIMFADVLIAKETLQKCKEAKEDFCLLVHRKPVLENTMRVLLKNELVMQVGSHIPADTADGNFIGVASFSITGAKKLKDKITSICSSSKRKQEYYTTALNDLITEGVKVKYIEVTSPWIEIDTLDEYNLAKSILLELNKN